MIVAPGEPGKLGGHLADVTRCIKRRDLGDAGEPSLSPDADPLGVVLRRREDDTFGGRELSWLMNGALFPALKLQPAR